MYLSSSSIRINTLHVAPIPTNPVIDLCHFGKICKKASTEKSFDKFDRQTDDGWTPDAFLCHVCYKLTCKPSAQVNEHELNKNTLIKKKHKKHLNFFLLLGLEPGRKKDMVSEINRWNVTTKRFYTCCSGQENKVQSTNTCEQSKCSV